MMIIVARRGMTELAPENTIAAYLKCVDAGVSWFQADVRPLADNALIMAHDEDAQRTTNGRGLFSQMEFGDLRRLDAGAWFDSKYRMERVPELTSVVELLNNTELHANIELRIESGVAEDRQTFVETVAQVLQSVNSPERLLISSRHSDLLSRLSALGVGLPLALTVRPGEVAQALSAAVGLGCQTVILPDADLTQELVDQAHAEGLQAWVRGVDGVARAEELRSWGVTGLITDKPQALAETLG